MAEKKTSTKRTRTVLTPAERIAKAEADLQAIKDKERAKAQAKVSKKREELDAANAKLSDAQAKVQNLTEELASLLDLLGEPDADTPEA